MKTKICTKCSVEKPLSEYHSNSDTLDGKSSRCKKCSNADTRRSYKSRPNSKRDELRKRRENPLYRIKMNLRQRLWSVFKKKGWVRETSFTRAVGCDWETLKEHIEEQFNEKMNWSNYGEYWEVDHIIPLSKAKNKQEAYKLNHYSNLQPLYWKDNREKSNKIIIK